LHEARLVANHRDGRLVSLAAGASTDQVVRHLVERGISVFEIAPEEQILEDFYLALMKPRSGEPPKPDAARS
jgi:hypothetical protein